MCMCVLHECAGESVRENDALLMMCQRHYGVALISRIDKITGRFCKRALQKRRYSAKETYDFIDPSDCSHPIAAGLRVWCRQIMYMCMLLECDGGRYAIDDA